MKRLRIGAINGVKGERRRIVCEGPGGWFERPAVVYNDWAIRRCDSWLYEDHECFVVHVPTGRAVPRVRDETSARSLVGLLLSAPRFRSQRAKKALAEIGRIYGQWLKVQAVGAK